jgi:hypothetical protein
MIRNIHFDREDVVHPELIQAIASQHIADLHAAADHRRLWRRGAGETRRRPSLRTRLGWLLVRWGQRLAPTPRVATGRRPATMGP